MDGLAQLALEQPLAPCIARIQLQHLVSLKLAHQMYRRRLANARRAGNQHRAERVGRMRPRLLKIGLQRLGPVAQPGLQLFDVGLVPNELLELLRRVLGRPQLARRAGRLERARSRLDLFLLGGEFVLDTLVEFLCAALSDQLKEPVFIKCL